MVVPHGRKTQGSIAPPIAPSMALKCALLCTPRDRVQVGPIGPVKPMTGGTSPGGERSHPLTHRLRTVRDAESCIPSTMLFCEDPNPDFMGAANPRAA